MRRTAVPGDVDPRGFAWPLGPLASQLDLLVQRAQEDLAHRERERLERQTELDVLQDEHSQQLKALASHGHGMDPALRRCVLSYLACALDRAQAQQEALAASVAQVQEARQAQLAAQRRSETLGRLRDAALGMHVAQERRRAAKEADHAWLAGQSRSAARRGDGGAP